MILVVLGVITSLLELGSITDLFISIVYVVVDIYKLNTPVAVAYKLDCNFIPVVKLALHCTDADNELAILELDSKLAVKLTNCCPMKDSKIPVSSAPVRLVCT
jgi:hypothetical protein